QRPAAVAGGDHVDGVRAELGDAVGGQRGDVVVLPAPRRKLRAVPGGLPVDPVGGGTAGRDHAGGGGRGADVVERARVAAAGHDRDTRGDRRLVGQGDRVVLGVRDRVAADGLVEHVHVVVQHGPLDR